MKPKKTPTLDSAALLKAIGKRKLSMKSFAKKMGHVHIVEHISDEFKHAVWRAVAEGWLEFDSKWNITRRG